MSSNKTLHELCDELRVTRRVIQGYEKAGLVSATGRNKYGHLLYNEKAQERIVQIRMYQQLGFSIREIKELIDAPDSFVKAKKKNIDIWIKEAYGIIKAIEDKEKQ